MVPEAEQPGRLSCKRGSACWTSSPRWSGEPKNDMQVPWAHWPKPPKIQLIWSYFVVAYRVVSYSGYVLGTGRESWPLILTYKLLVEVPSLATYRMILGTLWELLELCAPTSLSNGGLTLCQIHLKNIFWGVNTELIHLIIFFSEPQLLVGGRFLFWSP